MMLLFVLPNIANFIAPETSAHGVIRAMRESPLRKRCTPSVPRRVITIEAPFTVPHAVGAWKGGSTALKLAATALEAHNDVSVMDVSLPHLGLF